MRRILAALLLLLLPSLVRAEDRNAPVFYQADDLQYDREAGIVTATGHVEAWQNDRTLRADRITFDRTTNILAATGNVVLQEADGQVVFSDYAELTQDFKTGILSGMRARLTQNGRLVANGARRTDGTINELTRVIYSTCDLCKDDPTKAPLWQIRAREAVQDTENKRIEYRDAVIDVFGVPLLYTPYLTHPDPSQKRASGLLVPSAGFGSRRLGAFARIPYYLALDAQSDLTATGVFTGRAGNALDLNYRNRFNAGRLDMRGSIADYKGKVAGHLFAKGEFVLDDTFRWGFDIKRGTDLNYLRDFRIAPNVSALPSTLYFEGFGAGAYTRTDIRTYQNLTSGTTTRVPAVLPRTQYSFVGQPDAWGGRLSLDAGAFNVVRQHGTNTQRASLQLGWERPFRGPVGDLWTASVNMDSAGYNAHGLSQLPNYYDRANAGAAQAMPTLSLATRWPLARNAGAYGQQILEPIAKLMLSPRSRSYADGRIPNEDSLDTEFTDATLFARNRFSGLDRMEGGLRAAVALHGAWYLPGGATIDALFGQAFRARPEQALDRSTGMQGTNSDYVSRLSLTPTPWLDLTTRERFDRRTMQVKFSDTSATVGDSDLRVGAGYISSTTSPFYFYDADPTLPATQALFHTPRQEISLNAATRFGAWKVTGDVRRDLRRGKLTGFSSAAQYEDECFIFDVTLFRRYTSINGDRGDSGVLFSLTLKTVGEFGFHAN